jgi:LysR family tcuABC transcriptional regulator
MELRQLRYFVKVVELGSMGRAAQELGIVTSALSQQISRLESELATRLLQRTSTGVVPTDAGLAFLRQAQLALRHADEAERAARGARLSGHASVGLSSTTAAVLGLPVMQAMRERHPGIRLHMVESMSGHLAARLNARKLDLAVLFHTESIPHASVTPLLEERLFLIAPPELSGTFSSRVRDGHVALADLRDVPLIVPSRGHGLRATLDAAFARAGVEPRIDSEIDSLAMLMDAVRAGMGATLQPGAALARLAGHPFEIVAIEDAAASRPNLLASLPDEELSPAALAARVVLKQTARDLVLNGRWAGARLHEA